jgi:PAS domain S-box-containing protein
MNDQKDRFIPLRADAGPLDLEDALRHLHKAVETMQLGVTITDINGKIVYSNSADARMHGYTVEELIGKDVSVFCMPGYRRSLHPAQLRSMKSWRRESMNVRKDGTLLPVSLMSDVVLDAEDKPIGVVTTCEDLTNVKLAEAERERLQIQVQQSRKLESLAVLASGVAHDFNNLLSVISANASLILSELPAEASPVLNKVLGMQNAALRMSELTGQLLAYSGQGQRKTVTVDFNDVVKELVHFIEVSKASHVTLRYDLSENIPTVTADPVQLQQVIRHLITNASEAVGDEGGVVTIRTGSKWLDRDYLATTFLGDDAPQGNYVFLEVVDTGVGMDPETKAKIFDPFFTTKFTGRGLGLAAVIGIVRSHGGVIRIDSATHQGTCITTFFPEDRPAQD